MKNTISNLGTHVASLNIISRWWSTFFGAQSSTLQIAQRRAVVRMKIKSFLCCLVGKKQQSFHFTMMSAMIGGQSISSITTTTCRTKPPKHYFFFYNIITSTFSLPPPRSDRSHRQSWAALSRRVGTHPSSTFLVLWEFSRFTRQCYHGIHF